jgi:hypothetical protein
MKLTRKPAAPLPGMMIAEEVPQARRTVAASAGDATSRAADPALLARRERLAERLTTLQLELGGLYYEMAIRDHVLLDVLNERAGRLQQLDSELAHVDELIASGSGASAGTCTSCQAPYARGAAFCWQCGGPLGSDAADR